MSARPDGSLLVNRTRGVVLATHIAYARTPFARAWGLIGRRSFPPGHALVLDPCGAIHTFFMRVAVDALFVSTDGRIVRAIEALPPWRIGPPWTRGACWTVELPAGTLAATGTQVGDVVALVAVAPGPPVRT